MEQRSFRHSRSLDRMLPRMLFQITFAIAVNIKHNQRRSTIATQIVIMVQSSIIFQLVIMAEEESVNRSYVCRLTTQPFISSRIIIVIFMVVVLRQRRRSRQLPMWPPSPHRQHDQYHRHQSGSRILNNNGYSRNRRHLAGK
jgi:hypothetical protein